MIYFENFLKKVENLELTHQSSIDILTEFCTEALISEKDMLIFQYYVAGKKQREISLLLNIHQPLLSRTVNICRRVLRIVYQFLFYENAYDCLMLSKKLLTANEYQILNYRLVGYSFKTIAKKIGTTTQYIGLANNNIILKLKKYRQNTDIESILTYLQAVNKHWYKKN